MPKVSKMSAAHVEDHGMVEDRHEDVDGYTVSFVTFRQDVDATPFLKGLPGDMCGCPHWGYVLKGKITFRFADRDESYEEGDAYYLPGGHIPIVEAGSEIVQFSPAAELKVVSDTMTKNAMAFMGAMQSEPGS